MESMITGLREISLADPCHPFNPSHPWLLFARVSPVPGWVTVLASVPVSASPTG